MQELRNCFMHELQKESDSLLRVNHISRFIQGARLVKVNGQLLLLSSDTRALLQVIGWQR
jgi:hypothetical protein